MLKRFTPKTKVETLPPQAIQKATLPILPIVQEEIHIPIEETRSASISHPQKFTPLSSESAIEEPILLKKSFGRSKLAAANTSASLPTKQQAVITDSSTEECRNRVFGNILKRCAVQNIVDRNEITIISKSLKPPETGLMLPKIAVRFNRAPEVIQERIIDDSHHICPLSQFEKLIAKNSLKEYRDILSPFGIYPIHFSQGNITCIMELPEIKEFAAYILKLKSNNIKWVHPIICSIAELMEIEQ